MSYRPEIMKPFSDNIKVEHKVSEPTETKPSGLKSAGGNVGGANPSILGGLVKPQNETE